MPKEAGNNTLKNITKGATIIFLGMFFGQLLSYIARILIGRWFGPDGYGLLSLGLAILSILTTICILGLGTGITRYVSYFRGLDDKRRIKGTITASLKISFITSLAFSILLFIFSDYVAVSFFHNPQLTYILQIFSLILPFNVFLSIFSSTIRGFQEPKYKFYSEDLFYSVMKILLVSLAFFLGFGIFGVSVGWGMAIVLTAILSGYYLEKRIFPILKTKIKSEAMAKDIIFFSLPLMLGSMLNLILGWTDTILLGLLKTSKDVGVYSAALPTADIILKIVTAISFMFLPIITELVSKKKVKELNVLFITSNRWIFITTLPLFMLMILFPGTILNLLFGQEYSAGEAVLSILAIGFFFSAAGRLAADVTISMGKTKIYLAISFAVSLINIIFNIMLIPTYGILGAAVAMTISLTLSTILYLFFVYRMLGFFPYSRKILRPTISVILSGCLVYVLSKSFEYISLFEVIVLGTVFLLTYIAMLFLSGSFLKEDIEIMKAIERKGKLRLGAVKRIYIFFASRG